MKKHRHEELEDKDAELVLEYGTAEDRADADESGALAAAGIATDGARGELERAEGDADEESPEDRDPEDLDRELGIDRGPEDEVRSSAEVLEARDRRRR